MPRISNELYIQRHRFLRKAWTEGLQEIFAVLRTHQQWDVHKFYQPDRQLTDQQLIDYRLNITRSHPTLPQRASRSYLQMQDAFDHAYEAFEAADLNEQVFNQKLKSLVRSSGSGKIRVTAIAKPAPDLRRLAHALVDEAQRQVEEEHRERAA